ncbi:hypothetical protein RQM59_12330 [Flavobacteriaceae bacterium S356]|uniref:Uncharacterized protein n=1 Tax=Asprobacillus argus TaxID=3076534 RepID=A0ABU3LHR5_9FLAO|nr:hypothetical protein [Flavobacteriaceae bacterium S356]
MEKGNANYQKWKQKYELDKKQDKKSLYQRGILVFGGIILISTVIYLWSAGHLQFIGKDTREVEGTVTKIADYHIGRGNYIPRLTIEYFHENTLYTTYENIRKSGEAIESAGYSYDYQGDIIVRAFVTYDVNNPSNCRVRLEFQ